jgi:hypothetical protein
VFLLATTHQTLTLLELVVSLASVSADRPNIEQLLHSPRQVLHCIALPCLCLCLAGDLSNTPPDTTVNTHTHTTHTHLVVALTFPRRRRRQSTPSAAAADFRPPICPSSAASCNRNGNTLSLLAAATTSCSAITFACYIPSPPTLHPSPALASAKQHVWRLESFAIARRSTHRQPGR